MSNKDKQRCERCGRMRSEHTPLGQCIALVAIFTPSNDNRKDYTGTENDPED